MKNFFASLKKDKKKLIAVIAIIVGVLVIAGVVLAVTLGKKPKKEAEQPIPSINAAKTETLSVPEKETFAFFGVDKYGFTPTDIMKSDVIMLMTVDHINKKISLTSILRDSQVNMGEMGTQKINVAYQAGGPDFALQVINDNFYTSIDQYLTLGWDDVVKLIDSIGGVDVEITDLEAETINSMVWMDISGEGRNVNCQDVAGGYAHLDGTQAVHFARIRKIDSDYFRAGRQQRVLQAIQVKINQMGAEEYPDLVNELFGTMVESNLDPVKVAQWVTMGIKDYTIEGTVVPDENYETDVSEGYDSTGAWVWVYNLDNAAARIHSIID